MHSPAQIKARQRNHLIMRLRGAHRLMREVGSKSGMKAVDSALKKLGAVTEAQRAIDLEKEMDEWVKNLEQN